MWGSKCFCGGEGGFKYGLGVRIGRRHGALEYHGLEQIRRKDELGYDEPIKLSWDLYGKAARGTGRESSLCTPYVALCAYDIVQPLGRPNGTLVSKLATVVLQNRRGAASSTESP